jgi:hypothetical protein
MKDLEQFILEKEEQEQSTERGKLKFYIYKDGKKKPVKWLEDKEDYQKIVCNYEEKPDFNEGIKLEVLLGRGKNGSWQLWAGKPGVVTYADDAYKDLDTEKFQEAIIKALDETEKLIGQIKKEPQNWVQFYV